MDQSLDKPPGARIRLYRSVLFVPASNQRALAKAPGLAADAFVLDLEDSVAADQKAAARAALTQATDSGSFFGREVIVRVNAAPGTNFDKDLECVAASPPGGILVPKINRGADIDAVIDRLETSGLADVPLWVMVETAGAIVRLEEVTARAPRLAGVFFGANDLARDLGLTPGAPPTQTLVTAAAMTVIAARAAGIRVIGPVYNDVRDAAGFVAAVEADAGNGFDGKSLIHPSQIEPANRTFAPSEEELENARGMLDAYASACKDGAGVALHKGKMIEQLHVDAARNLLAIAAEIARRRRN